MSSQIVAWFWDSYAPLSQHHAVARREPVWLHRAVNSSAPVPALKQALLAISLTKYGKVTEDVALYEGGRRLYAQALRGLQKALYSTSVVFHDDLLAAIHVLLLYELFESTSNNRAAWHAHLTGISRLLKIRGPERHRKPVARTIFEDLRYVLMLQPVLKREESVFGRPEWLAITSATAKRSVEQRTLDIGFEVASTMAKADRSEAHAASERLEELLDCYNSLYERLRSLEMEMRAGIGSSDSGKASGAEVDDSILSGKVTKNCLERSRNPQDLLTSLPLLTLQLAIARDGNKLQKSLQQQRLPRFDPLSKALPAFAFIDQANSMDLARRILSIVPLCLQGDLGLLGASRAIFPLSTTLRQVSGIEPEHSRCLDLLKQVAEDKGVRFAEMIGPLRPDLSSKTTTVTETKLIMSPAIAV